MSWVGTDNCPDALRLYKMHDKAESEIENLGSSHTRLYLRTEGRGTLSRPNCAEIRFIDEGARFIYPPGPLVPQSPDERAAAVRFAKAEKDRADLAAAMAKVQADREAEQRAHEAAEKAKLQTKCKEVFKATGNKKVTDLTVVESQQIQACTTLGMYHQ